MKKSAVLILAATLAGCAGAGREDVGRTGIEEPSEYSSPSEGTTAPAEPNFPTGVPGTGVPESAPGGIR